MTSRDDATLAGRLGGRFLFLDALRGIAAMAVVLFHLNNPYVSSVYEPFSALLPTAVLGVWHHLDLGVEIFFVLSGFVIAHSLAGQRITAAYAGNFILRRSIRLDPPYWFMIFFCIGWPYLVFPTFVPHLFQQFGGWRGVLINMFYLPDLMLPNRIVGVAWTLCLEVQFYLAYLIFMHGGHLLTRPLDASKRSRLFPLLVIPFVLLTTYSLARWFTLGTNDFWGRWWMFASGAALYTTVRRNWSPTWAAVALATLLSTGLIRQEPRSIVIALTGAVILLSATLGTLQSWLPWRWLQYLGRTSYSLYLVHMTVGAGVIGIVHRFGDGSTNSVITAVVAGLLTSLFAADLLHRFIEAPAARFSQRFRAAGPKDF